MAEPPAPEPPATEPAVESAEPPQTTSQLDAHTENQADGKYNPEALTAAVKEAGSATKAYKILFGKKPAGGETKKLTDEAHRIGLDTSHWIRLEAKEETAVPVESLAQPSGW